MTPEEAYIKATKFRAKVYYYFYDELSKAIGEDKATQIYSRAIYRLGVDKSNSFAKEAKDSAEILANEFIKDEIGKNVFDQSIIKADRNEALVKMKCCPLVEMWKEMNLSKDVIKKLCDIAHQVDFGTIEGKGLKLEFMSRISDDDDNCLLRINK